MSPLEADTSHVNCLYHFPFFVFVLFVFQLKVFAKCSPSP